MPFVSDDATGGGVNQKKNRKREALAPGLMMSVRICGCKMGHIPRSTKLENYARTQQTDVETLAHTDTHTCTSPDMRSYT